VTINTGNKKVDGKYYNIIGDKNVQLSASGHMWLVGGSGITLISQGYVDVSGLRAHSVFYNSLSKIDNNGNVIPTYPGADGALVYKSGDNSLASIPNSLLIYNTGIGSLTMPGYAYGPLYVTSGNVDNPNSHELKSYPHIEYNESTVPEQPPTVKIHSLTTFTSGIQIYPNYEGYKGSVLTHMGTDSPAEWAAAPYLKADGVLWNRYSKRPVKIENGKIIFYKTKPVWSQDWVAWDNSNPEATLLKEFGEGFDTIELVRNDTRETVHVKFASQTRYILDQITDSNTSDPALSSPEFQTVSFVDPEGDSPDPVEGLSILVCNPVPWQGGTEYNGNGYAYSITRGGYLDMQIGRSATESFSCDNSLTTPFKFKPSTLNTISIRPNIYTAFNMLGENIDFVVYGQKLTNYNNYDASIFGLDENNLPSGLIPAFRVHASVPHSVSGSPNSGVYFTKYLDRAKVTPSGFSYDEKSKVVINSTSPYAVDSIPSGTGLNVIVPTTGYLTYYADLTVRSTLFSENVIAENIYLRPKPTEDNSGTYIQNALLTVDQSGKIISRIPKTNPVVPSKPSNVMLDPGHTNGIGNAEISLSWNAPSSDGNSNIINYVLQFSANNGSTWTTIPISSNPGLYKVNQATSNSTNATVAGLSPVTTYLFRVAAQNSVGVGDFSDPSTTIQANGLVPKAPYDLNQVREFDNTQYSDIILSWVDSQGGSANILGYTIEESSNNGKTWYYHNSPSSLITDNFERISGSTSANNYYYRVSSWNSYGQSAYSYIYSSGNYVAEDPAIEEQKQNDILSNWDFGSVLFTGVCPT
jgi:hypothetical protein